MANRKRGLTSIVTNKYLFAVPDGKGPLKSTFSHCKGWVALISLSWGTAANRGFGSTR